MRTGALVANVGTATVHEVFHRVVNAINTLKPEFISMPTLHEMWETAHYCEEKFKLPGFAFAVDGVHCRFDGKPRGVAGEVPGSSADCRQAFYNWKYDYTINCQAGFYITKVYTPSFYIVLNYI